MRTGMEWDPWFLELCQVVAKKSQCLSRKIGSVLVRDKSVIAVGWNGPPRGIMTCDERWLIDTKLQKQAGFEMGVHRNSELYQNRLEGICPRYVPEMGFKSGQGLEWCIAQHSERATLISAAKHGIQTNGCKLFMSCGIPCSPCLVEIINAGIEEIIVTKIEYYDQSAQYLLENSGLKYRVYDHLKVGLTL